MDLQNAANWTIPEGGVRNIHDKDKRLLWSAVGYDVKYKGDTTQQTYSGKNLLNVTLASTKYYEVTVTVNPDKSITLNGTYSGSSTGYVRLAPNFELPAGTYTLSNGNDMVSESSAIFYDDGHNFGLSNYTNTYTSTFTSSVTVKPYIKIGKNSVFNNFKIYPMIVPGAVVGDYEPYTGGIPSPSPDYPQDINVVTGEQTVNITGKNLFSGYTKGIRINPTTGGVETNSTAASSDFIPLDLTGSNKAIFSGLPNTLYSLVAAYNSEKVFLGRTSAGSVGSRLLGSDSFTSGTPQGSGDVVFIRLSVYENSSAQGVIGDIDDANIQLELGDTATAYEPYQSQSYTVSLGSVELCKIGDYQDYIYKSVDDWYVHKEIGKCTFTGSEGWGEQSNYNTDNRMLFGFNATNLISGDNIANRTGINNNFIFTPVQGSNIDVTGFYFHQSENYSKWIYVKIQRSLLPTEDSTGFKTWLSNNNMTVYYQMSPAIDTKITDSTLIGQLNAIHDWLRRYDYYGVVSGNLPIIINRSGII